MMTKCSGRRGIAALILTAALALSANAQTTAEIPVVFTLDKPGYVTLVAEDKSGNRVANLLSETYLPAGKHRISWDGYDVGNQRERNHYGEEGPLVQRRIAPGTYRLRGLVHDKLSLRYEFSVNNAGNPPWKTREGDGGWLADHTPPSGIVYLPKGTKPPGGRSEARFLVCSDAGEAGDAFVWLDAEGQRLAGTNTGFWGATHATRDDGPNAVPEHAAYVLTTGELRPRDNTDIEVRAVTRTGEIVPVVKAQFPAGVLSFSTVNGPQTDRTALGYPVGPSGNGVNGIAFYNGYGVISFTQGNRLYLVDVRNKKVTGEFPVKDPRGVAFDARGNLLLLVGNTLKRYRVTVSPKAADPLSLTEDKTLIASGLVDPRRLTLDTAGNIYIADWRSLQQIKVFAPDGKPLRTIGKPGGPQLGRYDEQRMSYPCGFTVDDKGRLWVAEYEGAPKRLSLWTTGGKFIRGFYGPPQYGGGGAIDPADKSRFYYGEGIHGISFTLDWEKGTFAPRAVYWRSGQKNMEGMPGPAPDRCYVIGGRRYLVNSFTAGLRDNQDRGIGVWLLGEDEIARPVAIIGNANDLIRHPDWWGEPLKGGAAIAKLWEGKDLERVFFVWSDRNGDHLAEPDEIQWKETDRTGGDGKPLTEIGLMALVHPDLSFTTSYGTRTVPPTFDSRGTPIYDINKTAIVGDPSWLRSPLIVGNRVMIRPDTNAYVGCDLSGQGKWRYNATGEETDGKPPAPGTMVQPTRYLGPPIQPKEGEAGPFVAISGEKGAIFLLTMDGYYLQTLGGDIRYAPLLRLRDPKRGLSIDGLSFLDEHFHPTINQTADGKIYLVAGKESSSIFRLDGLETVRRGDFGAVTVTAEQIASLPPERTEAPRQKTRPSLAVASTGAKITADGSLSDWPADSPWARVDEGVQATARIADGTLYLAYRTGDPRLMDNSGGDFRYLFKKGGALDLMLGPEIPKNTEEGGPPAPTNALRLLVTRIDGKTKAVLFLNEASGASANERVEYASPVGKVTFAAVRDVSSSVTLGQSGGDYEVAIPLSLLLHKPETGKSYAADIGILRGESGQTVRRVYWSNKNTQIVTDLPSEAGLQPGQWGVWEVR